MQAEHMSSIDSLGRKLALDDRTTPRLLDQALQPGFNRLLKYEAGIGVDAVPPL
jgi:hypothetical protein